MSPFRGLVASSNTPNTDTDAFGHTHSGEPGNGPGTNPPPGTNDLNPPSNNSPVPTLRLSETHLTAATDDVDGSHPNLALTTISANYSVDFTPKPDANGGVVTYALSIHGGNGTASGFIDSQTGLADVLVQNGNTITGHVGGIQGPLAFTISINPNTGVVTFTEDRAVIEAQTSSNPSADIATMSANVVTLTATITDDLGRQASASLDLGKHISLTDDGPSVVANAATVSGLTLSDSNLTALTNNGINGSSPNAALTSVTGHFAGDFTDTSGADGLKSTAYALSIQGGKGTPSGLVDSQTGLADVLVQNGNTIEGHVGSANGALAFTISVDASGTVTFTEDRAVENNNTGSTGVTLSAGVLTLTQTITDNDGTSASAHIDFGPKLSITDDGPSVVVSPGTTPTLTLSESNLTFFTNGINGTDPDFKLTHTTGNFALAFTDTSGADGLKSTTYALSIAHQGVASGLTDSQTHLGDILYQNGNTITGFVGHTGIVAFTITLDPATGEVKFTEDRAVVQTQNGSDPSGDVATLASGVVTLTQTVTDNDGTTASASVDIGPSFSIADDGPKIVTSSCFEPALVVSEAHLTAHTNGVSGSEPNAFLTHASGNFSFAFIDTPGADGLGSIKYTLSIGNGSVSGLVDSQTHQKDVLVQTSATTITGYVGSQASGIVAFTITVNASGTVTFTEDRAVVQLQNGHDPSQDLASFAAGTITLTQTLVDKDGTTTSANLDISKQLSIADDGPCIDVSKCGEPTLVVSEANLQAWTNGVNGTVHNGLTCATGNFAGNFIDAFGADGKAASGAVSYALSIGNPAPHTSYVLSGLVDSQTHQNDVLIQINATTIEGRVGNAHGALAFTICLDPATGVVTFTEDRAVVQQQNGHDPSDCTASLTSCAVYLTQTITDGDGTKTSASLDIGQQFVIKDDGPTITTHVASEPILALNESNLTQTSDDHHTSCAPDCGPDQTSQTIATSTTANFSGVFTDTFGADGAAQHNSVTYALSISGCDGLHGVDSGLVDALTGQHDYLFQNGNTITAYVGDSTHGSVAFTITLVPSSGSITFTEDRSVETHGGPATLPAGLVTLEQTITDGDGTSTHASVNIGAQFSITGDEPKPPVLSVNNAVGVDETPGVQTSGGATDVLSTSLPVAIAALFNGLSNKGTDTNVPSGSLDHGALSFASSGTSLVSFTPVFGADGPAATNSETFALTLKSATSGLTLTDGTGITLSISNGMIIGTAGTDSVNSALSGKVAFAIAIDSTTGEVYVAQYLSLHQPNASDSNDVVTLAANSVGLTVTLTDRDGSQASSTADISTHVKFYDDGPSIANVQTAVVPDVANASFNGTWQPTFGADGRAQPDGAGQSRDGHGPAGSTYNVTDTGHQISGHEVFEVQVGGSGSYTFYEYTVQTATGAEMYASFDSAGHNAFFTLDVLENGTYTFDLDATSLPGGGGGGKTITFTSGGEHDFFYSANGGSTLTWGSYNNCAPNDGRPSNYDVLITSSGNNCVDISNGKMGVDGSQLGYGETLHFAFGTAQSTVTIGVAAGQNCLPSTFEKLDVTIWNAAHTISHTETLTLPDGTAIVVDQAHWVGTGSNSWITTGIGEVDVTMPRADSDKTPRCR